MGLSPPNSPSPALPALQTSGPKFWGRFWVRRKGLSYHPRQFLFQSWSLPPVTPIPNFHFAVLTPSKSPRYSQFAPPSRLCPAFSTSPLPLSLTSPRMRAPSPTRTLCHILSRALSSPLPSVVPTAGLDPCRYPEHAFTPTPQPHCQSPDPSLITSRLLSIPISCLSPRIFYPAGCQTFLCIRVVVCGEAC